MFQMVFDASSNPKLYSAQAQLIITPKSQGGTIEIQGLPRDLQNAPWENGPSWSHQTEYALGATLAQRILDIQRLTNTQGQVVQDDSRLMHKLHQAGGLDTWANMRPLTDLLDQEESSGRLRSYGSFYSRDLVIQAKTPLALGKLEMQESGISWTPMRERTGTITSPPSQAAQLGHSLQERVQQTHAVLKSFDQAHNRFEQHYEALLKKPTKDLQKLHQQELQTLAPRLQEAAQEGLITVKNPAALHYWKLRGEGHSKFGAHVYQVANALKNHTQR